MSMLECVTCDEGPCHMKEPLIGDEWPSECRKGLLDYADWTRVSAIKEQKIILQPLAMKMDVGDLLLANDVSPKIVEYVNSTIDQYISKRGDY